MTLAAKRPWAQHSHLQTGAALLLGLWLNLEPAGLSLLETGIQLLCELASWSPSGGPGGGHGGPSLGACGDPRWAQALRAGAPYTRVTDGRAVCLWSSEAFCT